jgi:two-component system, sensor histidine kinase and response regulator
MQLPDVDGLQLACAIKADSALAPLHLIMLNSLGQRGQGQGAQHPGISAFLSKPVRQSQLYNTIMAVMSPSSEPALTTRITCHGLLEQQAEVRTRVLLAEDNIVNQQLAVRMLEKLGCRVDAVANGHEVVEALTHLAYDLVFMDCQMPEMDGYDATAVIRAHESRTGAHIPIIAITANAMPGDREHCLQAGMDDYVSKPVKFEALSEMVRKWTKPMTGAAPTLDAAASGTATPTAHKLPSDLDLQAYSDPHRALQADGDQSHWMAASSVDGPGRRAHLGWHNHL